MPVTLSIVINNYNYAHFLGQAIESAIALEWSPKEVIVVDDGSTDNSKNVILNFRDKIKYAFKENGGQASAFNKGFELATGDYVWFLDADDYIRPDSVRHLIKALSSSPEICHFNFSTIRSDGSLIKNKAANKFPSNYVDEKCISSTLKSWYPPTSANVFKMKLLQKIFPIPNVWRISADTFLILNSRMEGEYCFYNEAIVAYRIHEQNNFNLLVQKPDKQRLSNIGWTMYRKYILTENLFYKNTKKRPPHPLMSPGELFNMLYLPKLNKDSPITCLEIMFLMLRFDKKEIFSNWKVILKFALLLFLPLKFVKKVKSK
ncbi:MAG: glycosyltransferase family 2 protein [Opitutales bacterium]